MIWMIEGTWSGYTSSQCRVVHRHFTDNEKEATELNGKCITYTDGTNLLLRSRKCTHGEGKLPPEQKSYSSLINDCRQQNIWNVSELKYN